MKKVLLVSGCSFTDSNYISSYYPDMDCSWPKWPEVLAEKLDMECINLARNGGGNEYIYSSLFDEITNGFTDRIGLVIAGWSQCQRVDYQLESHGRWHGSRYNDNGDIFGWVRKSLRLFKQLEILCENYNLPLLQFQMINLFMDTLDGLKYSDAEVVRNPDLAGKRHPYDGDYDEDRRKIIKLIDDCNVKNFVGWPIYTRPESAHLWVDDKDVGFTVEQKILRHPKSPEKEVPFIKRLYLERLIDENDRHPNKLGHEKIAEFLYDTIKSKKN